MAKGKKHGPSGRRDRLLGTYGDNYNHVHDTERSDFTEEQVWLTSSSDEASLDESWRSSEPNRVHPDRSSRTRQWLTHDENRHMGGLSLAFEAGYAAGPTVIHQYRNVDGPAGSRHGTAAAASAPVNVPDWTRMVRFEPMQEPVGLNQDEREWVPPHEYLAREHGKPVTTSVFEGVGRTLKGRDMSRVRDAVWSQTGFFG